MKKLRVKRLLCLMLSLFAALTCFTVTASAEDIKYEYEISIDQNIDGVSIYSIAIIKDYDEIERSTNSTLRTNLPAGDYQLIIEGSYVYYSGSEEYMEQYNEDIYDQYDISLGTDDWDHFGSLYRVNIDFKGAASYDIYVDNDMKNGTVTVENTKAACGSTVTLTVTPKDGYMLDDSTFRVSVDGESIETTSEGNGIYTFVMPNEAVTVYAGFIETPIKTNIHDR